MRIIPVIAVAVTAGLMAPAAAAQQLAQAAASAAARAGVAAAVRGDVKLAAVPGVREVGKDVISGDAIFLGDRITTGTEGRLQIMLLDETVFTIGPNAALVIDQFVFDPQTSAGKVTASVLKGTFRFVTGKVAKREPSDMEVKLPVGSIGVRGTSVAGETDGTRATVVLLGPGPDTNTNERVGRILVTGTGATGGTTTVEIVRPGFGTEIAGANLPPTPPVRIDPGRIAALTAPLAGTGPRPAPQPRQQTQQGRAEQGRQQQGPAQPAQPEATPQEPAPQRPAARAAGGPVGAIPAGGAPITQQAGQTLAGGLVGISNVRALGPTLQQAHFVGAHAAQTPPPPGVQTTYEQLRSISSGTATFAPQTVAMNVTGGAGTASYTISYSYDFGARSANGTISLTVAGPGWGTTGTGQFLLLSSPFATGSGPVNIVEGAPPSPINVPTIGGIARVDYSFLNNSNVVFKALKHGVRYEQGPMTATGGGVTAR